MLLRTLCFVVIVVARAPGALADQAPAAAVSAPGALPAQASVALANAWASLADGRFDRAAVLAAELLSAYPRSPAVLSLAIEAEIARAGAMEALTLYERWLGTRQAEEPVVLRRLAIALLTATAHQTNDDEGRLEALKALVMEGESWASATLVASAKAGSEADLRALAVLGNASAIDQFAARMRATKGAKWRDLAALGESRSPRVIAPIVELLSDPEPQNRAAAIEALGRLGQPDVIPHLRPLLKDERAAIRNAAAGALFQLGDSSGAALLEELASHEEASVRIGAAALMSSQPTEAWKALVRRLASDPDPAIRVEAARLLAREDPALSRALLVGLLSDPNPDDPGISRRRPSQIAHRGPDDGATAASSHEQCGQGASRRARGGADALSPGSRPLHERLRRFAV